MNIEKQSLSEAGVKLGNLTNRWNPKMKPYIAQKKGKLHLLDEQKIIDCFLYVKPQIEKMVEENNATILFVGTSPHLSEIVKQAAINCQSPYLVHRWLGGFLTNFQTISRTIERLKRMISLQQSEKFASLSKKEQSEIEKKINKSKKVYEGVLDLPEKPNALFIIRLRKEATAVREAKRLNIPVIAVCNTDGDPDLVEYLIPGNDYSEKSVSFLVNKLAEIIRESKLRGSARLSAEKNDEAPMERTKKWVSSKETNSI